MSHTQRDIDRATGATDYRGYRFPTAGRSMAAREYHAMQHVYWDDDNGFLYPGRIKRRHVRRVSRQAFDRDIRTGQHDY